MKGCVNREFSTAFGLAIMGLAPSKLFRFNEDFMHMHARYGFCALTFLREFTVSRPCPSIEHPFGTFAKSGAESKSFPILLLRSDRHSAAELGIPLRHPRDQRDRRPQAVPLRPDVLQRRVAREQALDQ